MVLSRANKILPGVLLTELEVDVTRVSVCFIFVVYIPPSLLRFLSHGLSLLTYFNRSVNEEQWRR